ncbi:hypothetical protein HW555_009246 [Spodoptera exigua]|uniref:Gustatory receptor n=1 Tax=Spodoptera exigua TaxID=7107 RepID=A0A835L2N3_SPOEX|nr:hypothetical protein HW555_009246 [Spodoptera exigua]
MKERHENDEEQSLKLFALYQNIFEVYDLYKDIFEILTSALFYACASIWLSKVGLLTIIHVIYSEKFYKAVGEAESACIQLMKNRNYSQGQERLFVSVNQMNRTFSKMNSCGLFCVDATLILCLMGAITDYAVVLLQFTFL